MVTSSSDVTLHASRTPDIVSTSEAIRVLEQSQSTVVETLPASLRVAAMPQSATLPVEFTEPAQALAESGQESHCIRGVVFGVALQCAIIGVAAGGWALYRLLA
jgi:hypothetical protein